MDIHVTSHPYLALGGVLVVLVLWNYSVKRSQWSHLPLPPGPKGFPIIGNLFGMPQERPWLVFNDWSKIYGDIIYFETLGQGFLILGSLERTTDLLEKRSVNYSDRPNLPMLVDLMGWHFNVGFQPYGSWWRRHRRSFHQQFHPGVVSKYQPIQLRETHAFLRRLLLTPENFLHHVRHTLGATVIDIAYGIKISEANDPYISMAEEVMTGAIEVAIPGRFLVDMLPILKYVPSWMPGAGFKRKAAYWRKATANLVDKPFEHVKETLRQGNAASSVAATLIEALPDQNDKDRAEEEIVAKDTAAVVYIAGADTTASAVQWFFLAMAMYPEVQRRAQAEIDAVVGLSRLPDFNDRPSLPFINAVVKETIRWQMISPLALGHTSSNHDEYNGYFIPKGTIVLGNAWAILHNPSVYPSPEEFKPERWLKDGELNPEVMDPTVVAFGFGRRICPGRFLSDNSLYAMVTLTLSVYNISPPVDDQGNDIHLEPNPTSVSASSPVPFDCIIKPRSSAAEALIREEHAG